MVREGSRVFQDARDEDAQARAEGAAFLVSAWEDANTFIAEAPPDTRHMLGMLGWYVLLTVVVRGPELSADLRELDVSELLNGSLASIGEDCCAYPGTVFSGGDDASSPRAERSRPLPTS